MAQLNFSSPWKNITNPTGGTITLALSGTILPLPLSQIPNKINCQMIFKNFPNFGKKNRKIRNH